MKYNEREKVIESEIKKKRMRKRRERKIKIVR
jgi:hypothetical protein